MAHLQYESLDRNKRGVRLLKILPHDTSNLLSFEISCVDLDDQPLYNALSYTWDRDGKSELVRCNGMDLRIGRNLWDFLIQYRASDVTSSVRLWVDAICINQNDIQERNQQVSQMRAIYSLASSVIAWIGQCTTDEHTFFELAATPFRVWTSDTYRSITSVLTKPYFSRVWIVQEFLLADTLYLWCGEYRANVSDFAQNLLRNITPYEPFDPDEQVQDIPEVAKAWRSPGRALLEYRRYWHGDQRGLIFARKFRLRALLDSFSTLKCSERYDKIYALLGIAYDTIDVEHPIRPDYSKTPFEVFVDVLRNQTGNRMSKDTDEIDFVDSLRSTLGISRMDLANYVLQRAPDVSSHIYVVANGIQIRASLSVLGVVQRYSAAGATTFQLTQSEHSAFDAYMSDPDRTNALRKHLYYRWHRLDDRYFIEKTIMTSTNTLISQIINHTDQSSVSEKYENCRGNSDSIERLSHSFILGSKQCMDLLQGNERRREQTDENYHLFIGTNGIRGVIEGNRTPHLERGALIAVFSHAETAKNALLLQQTPNDRWYIAGVAILLDPEPEIRYSPLVRAAKNATKSIKDSLSVFNRRVRSDGSVPVSRQEELGLHMNFCFQYCTLVDLLDFCRCSVLDQSQLQFMLGDAFEAETSDDPHQCNQSTGGCNLLNVGSTWSGTADGNMTYLAVKPALHE